MENCQFCQIRLSFFVFKRRLTLRYSFENPRQVNDEAKRKVQGNLLPLFHNVHICVICMNDVPTHNAKMDHFP